jgi:transposase
VAEREPRRPDHAELVICEQSIERDFAWASRFRRLVKDYERLPETVAGLHFVAFACLFLQQAADILSQVHNTL